jgi:hypothetical protein
MLLTQKRLRQLLGVLWLIDGLLQLQPQMFTMNMVNGVMVPTVGGQPGPVAATLQWIIAVTTHNLVLVNLLIAVIQIVIGVLLISGLWVRGTIIASVVWALIVWYGGEGMSMLFTGQAGILTGAPGAVLLYPLLGLLVYPRKEDPEQGLLPRPTFRYIFAGFWFFSALLQLQPFWWQPEQISQAISGMVGQGGLDGFLVDPLLQGVSNLTAHSEILLNIVLIVVCLALGFALVFVKEKQLRPVLVASIVVSVLIWWLAQGFGMIFTGMATDFNSGLLLVVMALACWPRVARQGVVEQRSSRDVAQSKNTVQPIKS